MIGNIILLLVAFLLAVIITPIGFIYAIIDSIIDDRKTAYHYLSKLILQMAVGIDQLGNVILANLFNDILITKDGHKFGNVDETISSVLGKNQNKTTLKLLGKSLVFLLNKIDINHCIKSIED